MIHLLAQKSEIMKINWPNWNGFFTIDDDVGWPRIKIVNESDFCRWFQVSRLNKESESRLLPFLVEIVNCSSGQKNEKKGNT